ncbi:MAG TPA: TorF family putative porin [Caulobacteraceae bacterium]|nr:TorF family putative porin [Caulobacteraceae bacterium]
MRDFAGRPAWRLPGLSGRAGASARSGYPLSRARRLAWLGALAASGWAGACTAAQLEASASVDSDYQWQGLSLSDGQPAASVAVSGDFRRGIYGSLIGVIGSTERNGLKPLAYIADFGYAHRFGRDAAWDVGVVTSGVRLYERRHYAFTYTQIYGGLAKGDLSAHLFYSPSYLGEGDGSLYLDVDGAVRPATHWRLTAHAGAFTGLRRGIGPSTPIDRARVDLRAGVVRDFGALEGHVFLTTTLPNPVYPPTGLRELSRAIVLGATYTF